MAICLKFVLGGDLRSPPVLGLETGRIEDKLFKLAFRLLPNLVEHVRRQASGLGILQAGVIGAKDPRQTWESLIKAVMPKRKLLFGQISKTRQAQQSIQCNLPQHHHSLKMS